MELEINQWVNQAPRPEKGFRQAVHVILTAIATSDELVPHMFLKGGLLMAIRYKSNRFTKDIDFSYNLKYEDFDIDRFKIDLQDSISNVLEDLNYGISCSVTKVIPLPRNVPDPTHPSLKITIGYGRLGTNEIKSLQRGQPTSVIKIDCSFNEPILNIEKLTLEGSQINAYGLYDMIAEKFRSLIQQPGRNRMRRQDVYDLNHIIAESEFSLEDRMTMLKSLKTKSQGRLDDDVVNKTALDNPEVYDLAKKEYHTLKAELSVPLPDFDEIYQVVNDLYKSLPWDYASE
jgi:predicted nucleotidyltransferase component of viral defense system